METKSEPPKEKEKPNQSDKFFHERLAREEKKNLSQKANPVENTKFSTELKKIELIAQSYYARKDIQNAMYEFCKHREVVANFNNKFFAKRPDCLDYPSDILNSAKKGATSFHCSEEIWENPIDIKTDMTPSQYNEIKIGWDFIVDIDSPFLDYGKIAARLLLSELEKHGVKNYGVKFSVSGDTPILIELDNNIRLISIKEVIGFFKQKKDIKVLSLDKNKKLVFSKIYDYLEHNDTIYEIYHGQSKIPVKTTAHHSVFVWKDGEIIEKKVSEIKSGEFLITFNSENNSLSAENQIIENNFIFGKEKITRKIKIDKNIMRLIGYFLAEGHVTNIINQTGFSFNINEIDYIEDCKNLLKNITDRKISIRHPNTGSTQILIHSKEWANFFDIHCGKKKNKHLPSFSWKLPKELFIEMLRGYIRGDGHKKGEYAITIKSVSKQLITELIWLCKLNNISCSLSWEQNKEHILPQGTIFKGSLVYIIKIPKSELFTEFYRERNKFSPYPHKRTFPIDGLQKAYKQLKPKLFNHYRCEQMTLNKKRANLNRIKKILNWFEKTAIEKPTDETQKIISNYNSLVNSDIGTVEVLKIDKKNEEPVFDISVQETESFFGNFFPVLLHNSGSKGFHILVPFAAFPSKIGDEETKNHFPEWARLIAQYLFNKIKNPMNEEILRLSDKEKLRERGELISKNICPKCGKLTSKKTIGKYVCRDKIRCKSELESMKSNRKEMICPSCNGKMDRLSQREIDFCEGCKINTAKLESQSSFGGEIRKNKTKFIEEITTKSTEDSVDLVLVSSRHLFRAPYSLHEKTAYASIPLEKSEIENFRPTDADPLKIKEIRSFMPKPIEGEARKLLLDAIEWGRENAPKEQPKKFTGESIDLKGLTITEDMFPTVIKKILQGIKTDGRKRALSLLLSFFSSLEFPKDYVTEKITEWNKKNYNPLKEGYVRAQIEWYAKNKRLPPNYDKPIYKEFGVTPEPGFKNPINYTIRKAIQSNQKTAYVKPKNPREI